MKLIGQIVNRLFGNRWICEYCGDIQYCRTQPYCKPCCHVHNSNVKMIKINKEWKIF